MVLKIETLVVRKEKKSGFVFWRKLEVFCNDFFGIDSW